MERRSSLAAVVLAAGAGTRFGSEPGAKLLASVGGQPVLGCVLAELRAYGPAATLVVLGHGADKIEQALAWTDEIRVRNHSPERGLASSLQVGIDALRVLPGAFDGAFIVLGDQPLLSAETMRKLEAAATTARPADRPAVVPRYDAPGPRHETPDPRNDTSGPRNPLLLLRPAWTWVDELEGDHGLGPLIAQRPEFVLEVAVSGRMPDVDTLDDLARLEPPAG